ncbi:MAG TPA: acyl-CoA thioesterase [Chitinophagaceae bacterium]|nr:acyl-CoA thioesterase [Chitinophagaceae bacterium]
MPETKSRIRFPDCDPFNHLNNSKYIDYCINAREDHLMQFYDFDLHNLAKEKGVSWVVSQNRIAYFIPASLMEIVTIQSCVLKLGEKDTVVEMIMWDENKTHAKCLLWTNFTHFNLRTKKSEFHTQEFTDKFSNLVCHELSNLDFEDRIQQLRFFKKKN